MKKISIFFLILAVCCSIFSATAAAETDLFYCDPEEPTMEAALEQVMPELTMYAKRYIEEQYLSEDTPVDESKIRLDTTKIHTTYEWSFEDVSDFLRAEDKEAFLNTLKVEYYTMPVYYDEARIEEYVASFAYLEDMQMYRTVNHHNKTDPDSWRANYTDKEKVERALIESGISGHTVLQTVMTQPHPFYFVMTEKDDQYYAIYMYPIDSIPGGYAWHDFALAEESELVSKRVLTADEVERVLATYESYLESIPEDTDDLSGGITQTASPEKNDSLTNESISETWIWVAIGGAVVLIGGLVTVLLIVKKRQAK